MKNHADVNTTPRRRATLVGARIKGLARPRTAVGALAVVAVAVTLAACGSSTPSSSATTAGNTGTTASSASTSSSTASATATVKSASSSQFGTILENSSGMALYTFGPNNSGTTNMCTGACLMAWPAVTVATGTTPTLAPGVPGTLGTAKQANGTDQVTYNGQLLYTFVSDSPGQVTGNGVAKFSVAKASASTTAATTPANNTPGTTKAHTTTRAPTTTAASGGGYQY